MAGEDGSASDQGTPPPAAERAPAPSGLGGQGGRTYYVSIAVRTLNSDVPDEELVQTTRHYAIKGVVFTVVGVVAILFPLVFGLAVEQLLAWLLLLGGGFTLIQFMLVCGSSGSISFLLLGALHFAMGLWLLLRPIEGLAALSFALSAWFISHGILKLLMAYQVRHLTTWPAVLLSGIISIGLGITIVVLTPTYGLRLVGIIFGADLLATGLSVLLVSLMAYLGRGHRTVSDAEAAREPLLGGHAAAPSA